MKLTLKWLLLQLQKLKKNELLMSITIVNSGASLVAFARIDNAWFWSKNILIKKTVTFFGINTCEISKAT